MMEYGSKIIRARYSSPLGELLLGAYDGKLCMCDWVCNPRRELIDRRLQRYMNAVFVEGCDSVIDAAAMQLDEYFERKRSSFDIGLLFAGTPFQQRVWQELLRIPYGTTISYAEQARRIGSPAAVRAVAAANAVNAISIFVPCHRVTGADGSLTGYAGGIDTKRYLINLENSECFTR